MNDEDDEENCNPYFCMFVFRESCKLSKNRDIVTKLDRRVPWVKQDEFLDGRGQLSRSQNAINRRHIHKVP